MKTKTLLKLTAESKPANGKPSSADTINGVTSEEMIRMNIEKLKKRAAPKPQKAPTSRFVKPSYSFQ